MPEPPLDALRLSELYDHSVAHRKGHGSQCRVYPSPQAPVWSAIAAAVGAKRVLEVGCGIGYQAACIALAAPGCWVETIENDDSHVELADEVFVRLGLADRVNVLRGDAEVILPELESTYDLVVEDAGIIYHRWLPVLARLTRPGGVLIVGNLSDRGRGLERHLPSHAVTVIRPRPEANE